MIAGEGDRPHLVRTRAQSWNPKNPALMHTSTSGSRPGSAPAGLQVMRNARGCSSVYAAADRNTAAEYSMWTTSAHHQALPSLLSCLQAHYPLAASALQKPPMRIESADRPPTQVWHSHDSHMRPAAILQAPIEGWRVQGREAPDQGPAWHT